MNIAALRHNLVPVFPHLLHTKVLTGDDTNRQSLPLHRNGTWLHHLTSSLPPDADLRQRRFGRAFSRELRQLVYSLVVHRTDENKNREMLPDVWTPLHIKMEEDDKSDGAPPGDCLITAV